MEKENTLKKIYRILQEMNLSTNKQHYSKGRERIAPVPFYISNL